MGIFGNDANSYFGADNYKNLDIGNMAYKDYGSYTPYSSNISSQAGDLISQFMSGKLSPEVLAQANKGFMSANEATREGSYGMPIGAQKGLEAGNASNLALSLALQGQQQQQAGLSAAMPYMGFMAGQNETAYNSGVNENRYGQTFNKGVRDSMAGWESDAMNKSAESGLNLGSLFQGAVSAGTTFGLNKLFPDAPSAGNNYNKGRYVNGKMVK